MRKERYELEISKEFLTFEFTSVGPKGSIRKRVLFQDAGRKNIYNLAFGDSAFFIKKKKLRNGKDS